jgi:hypothetical protein
LKKKKRKEKPLSSEYASTSRSMTALRWKKTVNLISKGNKWVEERMKRDGT